MIATGLIETAKDAAKGQLTTEIIREKVTQAFSLTGSEAGAFDIELLVAEFERDYHTYVGPALTLSTDEDGWQSWLGKAKTEIEWNFWNRYRTHLLRNENYPKPVVDSVDEITDETLNNLRDPREEGPWDRRGMVVGHVQSGKTTNYAGLICKAVDAGYKVVIVLTGFHNNLRTQTQIRLEEAFVGYDKFAHSESGKRVPVGVGEISSDPRLRVDTITDRSERGDFRRAVADNFGFNPGGRPLIFVIKKNASVLRNLVQYLEYVSADKDENGNPHISKIPLLLIDDEADQGSVDTAKMEMDPEGDPDPDHEPTTINRLIRQILFIFSESAYVGYTATPFANIFIHNEAESIKYGQDLFPRSFITTIPTPSNYIGPAKVFGLVDDDGESRQPGLMITRNIEDFAASDSIDEKAGWMPPKHDKNHKPLYRGKPQPPESLREAVLGFILGCAARALRGQESRHSSMLVHVTRFIDVQELVYKQVRELMLDIKDILNYGEEGSRDELHAELEKLWNEDFAPSTARIADVLCPSHDWSDVSAKLLPVAQSIEVKRINGSAGDVLDYSRNKKLGMNVIAIGGDKLSRGLTLEGLMVSYFTRPSRMYDTLMQMGRWFGYRDGFIDLCRLYAPQGLIKWFQHITDASEELRKEFEFMTEIGETPANYGQKVKSHPALMVTSQVKLRHSVELSLSYEGAISETISFSREGADVDSNFKACSALIEKINGYGKIARTPLHRPEQAEVSGKYLWSGVDPEDILNFLKSYTAPSTHVRKVNTALLAQYIERQLGGGDLTNWSVILAGKNPEAVSCTIGGVSTGLITRAVHPALSEPPNEAPKVYSIRRLVSPQDESWDLSERQYQRALGWRKDKSRALPSGPEIRAARAKDNALLMLYPLSHMEYVSPHGSAEPFIGFAISFPGNRNAKPIKYRINNVYKGQMDE